MLNKLKKLFQQSLNDFISSDLPNILANLNERNLCSRLAIHMNSNLPRYELSDYFADTEYNRNNGAIKTIIDENTEIVTINCDLILHSRGQNPATDNLIAIEMKKSIGKKEDKEKDKIRLRALTKTSSGNIWSADGQANPEHVCNYKIGFYVELNIKKRIILIEEYQLGCKVGESNKSF